MRSAIYYPSTHIRSPALMRSSLLLWDQLNVIVPESRHPISYADPQMAEAWLILGGGTGGKITPSDLEKQDAHNRIKAMLDSGAMRDLGFDPEQDGENVIELWPDKLLGQTWQLLKDADLTGNQLANGDYAFADQAGTAVMAKIADACGGEQFARITDRVLAHGLMGDAVEGSSELEQVIPLALDLVDASSLPMEKLIAFRKREAKEGKGKDFTDLRHGFADVAVAHLEKAKSAKTKRDLDEINRVFVDRMEQDLRVLRSEIGANRQELFLKPVLVSTVVGAGSLFFLDPGQAAAIGIAALGSHMPAAIKHVAEMLGVTVGYSAKQRAAMAKHPMAYMYALSKTAGR